jgi:hypothetical protein
MAASPPCGKCGILNVSHFYGPPRPVTGIALLFFFTLCRVHAFFMYIQDIHKRMVQFPKLIKNVLLILQGHNIHCQQREISKVLLPYQQFASHAYCGAAGPVSKMASQQEKAFSVFRYDVSRSVITVQCEFRLRFKEDAPYNNNVFFKPCTKLTLHCNHRSGNLITEHTESLLLLRRHLGNWSRGSAISMKSELLVAQEKLGQFPQLTAVLCSCR